MWSGEASLSRNICEDFFDLRLSRAGGYVTDATSAREQAAAPYVGTVVGEPEMVRLIAGRAQVQLISNLAVFRRVGIDVDDGEKVIVLGVGVDAEDVEDFFRPIQPFDKRGKACFCRDRSRTAENPKAANQCQDTEQGE